MKFKLTKDENVYFIETYTVDTINNNSDFYIGTVVLDMKRKTYYLIPTKNKKYGEELSNYFLIEMRNMFIKKLSDRVESDKLTGEMKSYCEIILIRLFKEYGIINIDEQERLEKQQDVEDIEYCKKLSQYNKGHYPEHKMYM